MVSGGGINFEIGQPNIIDSLLRREEFVVIISENLRLIANEYKCDITRSEFRLLEAHTLWLADIKRVLDNGTSPRVKELDHFKHAAFLCFWLRRTSPIIRTDLQMTPEESVRRTPPSEKQATFLGYGNELSAFLIGFQICQFFEEKRVDGYNGEGSVTKISGTKRKSFATSRTLMDRILRGTYIEEVAMILKHKNNSPHSINLIYKSLFQKL